MKGTILFSFFLLATQLVLAGPEVPREMTVCGIQLRITDKARRKIQEDVDMLTRSQTYYQKKADKINLYFPIIEQILDEEKVPDDIKFLVIQESALIGDAVSVSNAVGYWQFKEAAASEMGLAINRQVDERMNIVASTRGAARYLKFNNTYFDNWIYAVQSYQMGRGGAEKVVDRKYYGSKRMIIDHKTYWYVLKFLAHKVAFEPAVTGNSNLPYKLDVISGGAGLDIKSLARKYGVEEDLMAQHNKWVRKGKIPNDKPYFVLVPVPKSATPQLVLHAPQDGTEITNKATPLSRQTYYESQRFPVVKERGPTGLSLNNIPAIRLTEATPVKLVAEKADISTSRLLRYNDLAAQTRTLEKGYYYVKKKKRKAGTHYHTTLPDETLWSISQKYGIREKILMRKNRMKSTDELKPGRVLWLRFIRPRDHEIEYRDVTWLMQPLASTDPSKEGQAVTEEDVPVSDPELQENPVISDSIPVAKGAAEPKSMEDIPRDSVETGPDVAGQREESEPVEIYEDDIQWVEDGLFTRETPFHEVKKGETLHGISRQYKVAITDLLAWNQLRIEDGLRVGQQIRVQPPVQETQPTSNNHAPDSQLDMHEVQAGETLYGISRKYNISVQKLMEMNNLESFELKIGQQLQVPSMN